MSHCRHLVGIYEATKIGKTIGRKTLSSEGGGLFYVLTPTWHPVYGTRDITYITTHWRQSVTGIKLSLTVIYQAKSF